MTPQPLIRITTADWLSISPHLTVFAFAILVLMIDIAGRRLRPALPWLALVGVVAGMAVEIYKWSSGAGGTATSFYGMVVSDRFGVLMDGAILLGTALAILLSITYIRREELEVGEYYALILLAAGSMMFMVASADLIMVFITLEMFSISLYILSAYARSRAKSEEAGMKYLLLGAFSSAFLVYGIALIYGSTGTTNLPRIAEAFASPGAASNALMFAGVGLLLVGLGFKVSAVPFQVWTPDVYEGAPTPVTAFMSVGTKVAAFAAIARVFIGTLDTLRSEWMPAVWALAALTMAAGNVIAIAQPNLKRMLAYSSIAHAGYVLIAVAAANNAGVAAIPFYLYAYAFSNLGAWAVVIAVSGKGETNLDLQDYSGLWWRNSGAAFAMAVFMFGLTGLPPTGGFTGKFALFLSALDVNLTWLAVIGVLTTLVSAYYYLRVTVLIFMNRPKGEVPGLRVPGTMWVVIIIALLGTLILGVYPAPFFEIAQRVVPFGF